MKVRGVVENMSYYEHQGERLRIFGEGGGARVSEQLTESLGYDVPLLAQLPLEPELRETGEAGRPAVLNRGWRVARRWHWRDVQESGRIVDAQTYVMCGARIQAVMTRGMDSGLMRLRIHSSSGERLGGKRSEMK